MILTVITISVLKYLRNIKVFQRFVLTFVLKYGIIEYEEFKFGKNAFLGREAGKEGPRQEPLKLNILGILDGN